MHPRQAIPKLLKPSGKFAFLSRLPARADILDVGCGNNSSSRFKDVLPDCRYVGIDVADCNQTQPDRSDEYILTTPERFAAGIAQLGPRFDAVVSAHNFEHVDDRAATLAAMMGALRPGGALYLAFPSQAAADFPSRSGLSYFDDETHKPPPPDVGAVLQALHGEGLVVDRFVRRHRPLVLWTIGLLMEPASRLAARPLVGTHEFWGLESVIWARRPAARRQAGEASRPAMPRA